mgnify:CR=1 FL=1
MNKTLIFCIFLFITSLCICSCNSDFDIIYSNINIPGLDASLQIPVYNKYNEFSEYVNNQLTKDFEKYKGYALTEWELYQEDTLTYRTVFKDLSTARYINVFISKFIYCGPEMEDEYYITFSYDKKNKKILDITDCTKMDTETLSLCCKDKLKKNITKIVRDKEYVEFLNSCVESKLTTQIKNYSAFSIQNKKVKIYFAPGDIFPKKYGGQIVEFKQSL